MLVKYLLLKARIFLWWLVDSLSLLMFPGELEVVRTEPLCQGQELQWRDLTCLAKSHLGVSLFGAFQSKAINKG